MNSSASKSLDAPVSTGAPRWLLRGLIAALALLLLGLLAVAFLLGRDDGSPAPLTGSAPQQTSNAAALAAPQPAAASDGIEEVPRPVSNRRTIAGMEVDANGDTKDPDLAHPGDDSSYQNDGDDGQNHSGKDADTH